MIGGHILSFLKLRDIDGTRDNHLSILRFLDRVAFRRVNRFPVAITAKRAVNGRKKRLNELPAAFYDPVTLTPVWSYLLVFIPIMQEVLIALRNVLTDVFGPLICYSSKLSGNLISGLLSTFTIE